MKKRFKDFAKRILYPETCPICDRAHPINAKIGFCDKCKEDLMKNTIIKPVEGYCDGGSYAFSYEDVKSVIYRFKYANKPGFANALAYEVNDKLGPWINSLNADAFIPVPLHKKRLIDRGYNQATELAKALSYFTGIPAKDSIVLRIKNTKPQKECDAVERRLNMKNAFILRESVVNLNTVVLVDDIYTTGSTVDAIAKLLKENGVNKVYFLTVTAAGT